MQFSEHLLFITHLKANPGCLVEVLSHQCVSQSKVEGNKKLVLLWFNKVKQSWYILWPSKSRIEIPFILNSGQLQAITRGILRGDFAACFLLPPLHLIQANKCGHAYILFPEKVNTPNGRVH